MKMNKVFSVIQFFCFVGSIVLTISLLVYYSQSGTFVEIRNSITIVGYIIMLFFTTYILQISKIKD
jgi:uncharacterized membrane protein